MFGVLAYLLLAPLSEAREEQPMRKALFVIMDGIPPDVIERVETPHLDNIAGERGYARAYVGGEVGGESESPTISAVSYQSLLTGTWANKHNVWDNRVENPDYRYWDIFRIAKTHDPALQTAVFSTWEDNRTRLIGDGLAAAGGFKLDHYVDGLENDREQFPVKPHSGHIRDIDTHIAAEASSHIRAQGPDLTWVYFQYTDDIGHRFGDGPEQDDAVHFTDDLVGQLWGAVEARQSTYDEDWLVVVTTDHGRTTDDGKNHGGQSDRERATWIVSNSACLGDRFADRPGIVDILPSIVDHLELRMPAPVEAQLDGRSFLACSDA